MNVYNKRITSKGKLCALISECKEFKELANVALITGSTAMFYKNVQHESDTYKFMVVYDHDLKALCILSLDVMEVVVKVTEDMVLSYTDEPSDTPNGTWRELYNVMKETVERRVS